MKKDASLRDGVSLGYTYWGQEVGSLIVAFHGVVDHTSRAACSVLRQPTFSWHREVDQLWCAYCGKICSNYPSYTEQSREIFASCRKK